jgi:hypothetical protein
MALTVFAEHLGVGERTVTIWERRGTDMAIRDVNQQALDTSLRTAGPDVQDRFLKGLAADGPGEGGAAPAETERTARGAGDAHTALAACDADLVRFAMVLDQRGIGAAELTAAELACERLDQRFASMRPDDVLAKTRTLMDRVLGHLCGTQTLRRQERLVTLAARLAGLRAWACFNIDDHSEAERWYDAAVAAAQDAKAWGWERGYWVRRA